MGVPAEENQVWLLGCNVSSKSKWKQLLICGGGFFFGYMINGVCEEYVYNSLQFSYGWYFTFVQGFVYLGLISWYGFRPKHIVNPWRIYIKLSTVLMGSHGLTKGSLMFLNYPAQIMFKSTKVLPVMVMGASVPGLRRRYSLLEYVSAVLLVLGLVTFTLADAQTSPNFSIMGVVMVVGALVLDSFVGNFQEAIFTVNPATTQLEMLFCSTAVGLPMLIPPMLITGEFFRAWSNCFQHPYIYLVLIFEACATFIGQLSVLCLIALFGAATTAMVTTARKATTLLLSYIIFTKPLLGQHCTGLILIGMGITLKMLPDHCQYRIPSVTKYSPLPTEASTSQSSPTDVIPKLDQELSNMSEDLRRHSQTEELLDEDGDENRHTKVSIPIGLWKHTDSAMFNCVSGPSNEEFSPLLVEGSSRNLCK